MKAKGLKRGNFGSTALAAKPRHAIALLMGKQEQGDAESTDNTQQAKARVCWVFCS